MKTRYDKIITLWHFRLFIAERNFENASYKKVCDIVFPTVVGIVKINKKNIVVRCFNVLRRTDVNQTLLGEKDAIKII